MGVASLVLGILAIVCSIFLVGLQWIGAILGLIGIVLGALGKNDPEQKGISTAGLVCSIIGFILGAILFMSCVAAVNSVKRMF